MVCKPWPPAASGWAWCPLISLGCDAKGPWWHPTTATLKALQGQRAYMYAARLQRAYAMLLGGWHALFPLSEPGSGRLLLHFTNSSCKQRSKTLLCYTPALPVENAVPDDSKKRCPKLLWQLLCSTRTTCVYTCSGHMLNHAAGPGHCQEKPQHTQNRHTLEPQSPRQEATTECLTQHSPVNKSSSPMQPHAQTQCIMHLGCATQDKTRHKCHTLCLIMA